jgi:hypothetical protein
MTKETVIFLHVPRTAGTTLHRIIDRQYDKRADCWIGRDIPDVRAFRQMNAVRRAEIRMLRGHIPFGVHECIPGSAIYFTVLREPVERVISFYYFVRREPKHYAHRALLVKGMTLRRYVESRMTLMTGNFATYMISGTWGHTPHEPCTEKTLALAKRNIAEHFAVVGLTERFDETLLLLRRRFGWRTLLYRQLNVTPGRPVQASLPVETLAVLREHNQFDLELYAHAKQLFGRQIAAQGPGFLHAVQRFRAANRLMQALLWGHETLRKVSVRAWMRKVLQPRNRDRNRVRSL